MFYNLTQEDIESFRNKTFPRELAQKPFLRRVIINDSASDNIFKFTIVVNDGVGNIYKIFNNEEALKYLRLKVFQIPNPQTGKILQSSIKNIAQLEEIINLSGGAQSVDLVPSKDYIRKINKYIQEYTYEVTFVLQQEIIDYFSLGIIFYFDKEQYLIDKKIEEKFINEKLLFDQIYIYDIINNGQIINPLVQDLRLFKSTFSDFRVFDNLLSLIKSNKGINLLNNINEINTINIQKEVDKESLNTYLGPYFSRNLNKNIGFTFIVNYEKIINENTAYSSLLKRSNVKNEFIDKCKISSIKIFRQKLNDNEKNKDFPLTDTTELIVESSQYVTGSFITEVNEINGSISEIESPINNQISITRAFCVTDQELFSKTVNGRYRYGIELSISDGISDFLADRTKNLSNNLQNLIEYLNETNNIVKIVTDQFGQYEISGVYDPLKNAFTQGFVNNFNIPRRGKPSFQKTIEDAATDFINTLNLIGLNQENSEQVINTVVACLSPLTTSSQAISYFIKVYEELINIINNFIKNNKNNNFTIKKWFTNNYIDATVPIEYGYNYLNINNYRGLAVLNSIEYFSRLEEDIKRHVGEYTGDPSAYLSVNDIYLPNKNLNLKTLNENPYGISDIEFCETELAIKYFIAKGDIFSSNDYKINSTTTFDNQNIKTINTFYGDLTDKLSVNINSIININQSDPFRATFQDELVKIVQAEMFLSLIKQYENNNSENNQKTLLVTEMDDKDLPVQIKALSENFNLILKEENEYLNDIYYNSKFNLLFNTLHAVEVLEISDSFEEKWSLLTTQKYNSLNNNPKPFYVCRLKNYKNLQNLITGLDNINLPIFNQHFLLFPQLSLRVKVIEQSKKVENLFETINLIANSIATADAKALESTQQSEEGLPVMEREGKNKTF